MIRWLIEIIKDNIECFRITFCFAKKDIKRAHIKSDFGWFWEFAKPLIYILMFYFAISSGFRNAKDIDGTICPYFVWLAAGIVPWQYISDLLVGGATCFQKYRSIFMSRKYPLAAIPTIPVLAKLFTHCVMVLILMLISVLMGTLPSIYWLQLPVYMLMTIVFVYLWVMMTGLLNVMSADFTEFIKTVRTAFFWLSGILFNTKKKTSPFFTFNPIRFIAEGYRNTFAYHTWFWEEKRLLLNYCIVIFLMAVVTCLLHKRMEKRMAEFF